VRPGEIICKAKETLPHTGTKFKANIFWMGKQPFIKGKNYKLKIATQQVPVVLSEILNVLDASELSSIQNKPQVDRHDVAECVFETLKPIAFDDIHFIPETGRFVIVDNYEIAGGGIILAPVYAQDSVLGQHVKSREFSWTRSDITPDKRAMKYQHKAVLIVLTGQVDTGKQALAKTLEEDLFKIGKFTYFLGVSNQILDSGSGINDRVLNRVQHIQQLGELAHVLTDAGLILITSVSDIDDDELNMLKYLNSPNKTIVVNVGQNSFTQAEVDLVLDEHEPTASGVSKIVDCLTKSLVLDPEYSI
jgi:bifunctional enzyme CysN/CysC